MLIYITDDGVVLEAVPKEDCKGCYFSEMGCSYNRPLDVCSVYGRSIIWKPITAETKKLLKKEL